jgi:dihydrofolate synthase/folylpolyglutamate synthase
LSQHNPEYRKALDELLSLEFTGMKLGLDNIRELLRIIGDPQKVINTIHIAGSNGKGSVSSMLAAAFQGNGYKVGLYTSPHLVDFRERIKINGEPIPEKYIILFLEKIWKDVERLQATFFEVTTAMAFTYFADNNVGIAIIETGLGGRLDATNVLEKPLATVITSISLEHTAQLGNTLEEIASEKAGIMKTGVPAIVTVPQQLKNIFLQKGKEVEAPVIFDDQLPMTNLYYNVLPFPGEHQKQNLHTVILAMSAAIIMLGITKNAEQELFNKRALAAIKNTIALTGLRGRLEKYWYPPAFEKKIHVILDVAHNPDAFRAIKEYFHKANIRPIVVAGFAKDKDIPAILAEVSQFASAFIAVAAESNRALHPEELAQLAENQGIRTAISSTPAKGVDDAIVFAKKGDTILLTGSHYVVGQFLNEAAGANESKSQL